MSYNSAHSWFGCGKAPCIDKCLESSKVDLRIGPLKLGLLPERLCSNVDMTLAAAFVADACRKCTCLRFT